MPRTARKKHDNAIYHIMCRSISEILLFREDADKDRYLSIVKRYTDVYKCSVYAYCLMNNHLHMHLDPKGFDISKLMHSINTAYVVYYNKKYERHGHLFQERFQSRILDSERYNLAVSAYIHNNPKDIPGFEGKEEKYEYSSYGIYLGLRRDIHKLIDISFIYQILCVSSRSRFKEEYFKLVSRRKILNLSNLSGELPDDQIETPKNSYISRRVTLIRGISPAKVIPYILQKLKQPVGHDNESSSFPIQRDHKAFAVYVLRVLCGLGYGQICELLYNTTIAGCSKLCGKGYELSKNRGLVYHHLFNNLIDNFSNHIKSPGFLLK